MTCMNNGILLGVVVSMADSHTHVLDRSGLPFIGYLVSIACYWCPQKIDPDDTKIVPKWETGGRPLQKKNV